MEQTYLISEFKGLNDYGTPLLNSSYTRSLNAVETKYGRILGAKGISKLRDISTAAGDTIIGLMPFYEPDLDTVLYRMLPTVVEQLNTSTDAWDDVTGTALNGLDNTLPQFTVHKDTLCFVNEGLDRPRKLTGTGNSATLGGTPPYAKAIWQGWGFLFLGNISSDGSTFFPRRIKYSDDFDVDWSDCAGNELNFNETNGEILRGLEAGDVVVMWKSDSIFRLEFTGGVIRFKQPKMDFSLGLIAPLSPWRLDNFGIPFLGTDYRLHYTDGLFVKTVPPFVQKKLDDTLYKPRARWAVGAAYPDVDTYSLFYQASSADSWNKNRISFNFRTGEFSHRVYTAHEFTRLGLFRYSGVVANTFIGSTATLVYELDAETELDDTAVIDRYYDIDWLNFGYPGEKYLKGLTLECVRNAGGRISISCASDMRSGFNYEKFYDLRSSNPNSEFVTVAYRIDPGLLGRRFKFRIKFYHDDGVVVEVVAPAQVHWEPVSEMMIGGGNNTGTPERVG